jgi:hypothetical protein
MTGVGTWLVSLAAPLTRKVLASIGVGVVSYAAISVALNAALDAAKSAWAGFGGDALAIVQLAGVSEAMSIIAGALIARVSVMALNKLELLK